MHAALWQLTALWRSVEMFSACAHDAHTIKDAGGAHALHIGGGVIKSAPGYCVLSRVIQFTRVLSNFIYSICFVNDA